MIQITDDDLDFVGIKKKPWCDVTVKSLDPFDQSNKDRFSISSHFVDIICGKSKLDVMCNFAGKKGTTKSWSSVSIGYNCGIKTAIENDNDPTKWNDYFDIERNVAIMDVDKMIDILTSNEKYQTVISDDSGTIQGARKYKSDENQVLNDVFVVNRTNRCIYLSSAPETSHVDKQARNLPEHQIDFLRNPAALSAGFGICKYFERHTDPKTSESYYSYHFWKNMKVMRCVIQAPPKKLIDEYEKMREIGKAKIQKKAQDAKEKRISKENEDTTYRNKFKIQMEERKALQEKGQKLYDEQRLLGLNKKEALIELKKQLGIKPDTWRYWERIGDVQ